jgi:hypothetical protein
MLLGPLALAVVIVLIWSFFIEPMISTLILIVFASLAIMLIANLVSHNA